MEDIWVLVRVGPDSCSVLGLFRTPEEVHVYVSQHFGRLASSWYPPLPGRDHWHLASGGERLVLQRCALPAEQSGVSQLTRVSALMSHSAEYYAEARAAYTLSTSRSEPWPKVRPMPTDVVHPRRPDYPAGAASRRDDPGSERQLPARGELVLAD